MKILNRIFYGEDGKRKVILLDVDFQLKIINSVVALFMFIITLFYTANLYFLHSLKNKGIRAGLPVDSDYFLFIESSSKDLHFFFCIAAVITLVAIYYFGLRLSHRIIGPIFNINRSIDEMVALKKVKKIKLRKNDFFQDHADKINHLVENKDELT